MIWYAIKETIWEYKFFSVKRKANEAIAQAKKDAKDAERKAKRSDDSAILAIKERSKMLKERDDYKEKEAKASKK